MDHLKVIELFNRIAETKSFSEAAQLLNISRPSASRQIHELERRLGVNLFHRTTRVVTLTTYGETFWEKAKRIEALSDELFESLENQDEKPSGRIRISCSDSFARFYLIAAISRFMRQYPAIQTELFTHDGLPDLAKNRIDVAFQTMGLREPDYIAHELGQCRSILCSSEEYIRIHGRPRHPKDLLNHELIGHLQMPTMVRFTHNIEEVEIPFAGRFNSNSASVLLDAVRANLGIAILPDLALLTDLNQGRLVELLPDWQCPSGKLTQ